MIVIVPKVAGMLYAVIGFFVLAYMFSRSMFNRRIGYVFITTSTIVGFLVFAPMFPNQFQLIVLGNVHGIQLAIVGFLLFIVLTLVFGRIFCGYLCPIGAVQELAYLIPTKKLKIANKTLLTAFHSIFFIMFLFLAFAFSIGILTYLGFYDFFHLNILSPFFYVFLTLLIVSIFVYRPFCRLFCPYGMLLSSVTTKSLFRLQRNDGCIDCGKCERICPTNEAGRPDTKQECYMCNRCRDVCPIKALEYRKRFKLKSK